MAARPVKLGSTGLIKSMNKRIILDLLLQQESLSRTELSEATGLTMPTVMRIVDSFIADGLVSEIGKGDSSGGRKPVMLCINPNAHYFLGTDISRECHSVVINIRGEIIGRAQCIMDYQDDIDSFASLVRENMLLAITKSGVVPSKITYSGIGTPGIGFKFIRNLNTFFAFWSDADLATIKNKLDIGYPTVFENVARLGAVAELKFGHGRYLNNYIYIYADEGIGMGAVINGKLETGHNGVGCEFGHTTINFSGQQCYCGNRGCVESYCSSHAVIREYETNLLNSGKLTCSKNETVLYDYLCAAGVNQKEAIAAAEQAGLSLGIGIGNMINLYNPEAVIMGGILCKTIPSYTEKAIEEARKHIFINNARSVKFLEASIDVHPEAIGAAALAVKSFFEEYCKK